VNPRLRLPETRVRAQKQERKSRHDRRIISLSSTRRCLPFRSRAIAVEIIAFAVLCKAIVSRIEGFL
jgi:hypothetical protein